jgi:hypothetical protein
MSPCFLCMFVFIFFCVFFSSSSCSCIFTLMFMFMLILHDHKKGHGHRHGLRHRHRHRHERNIYNIKKTSMSDIRYSEKFNRISDIHPLRSEIGGSIPGSVRYRPSRILDWATYEYDLWTCVGFVMVKLTYFRDSYWRKSV